MLVHQYRCGLPRARRKLDAGAMTLGFIGGSITDGRPQYSWVEPVARWFAEHFPGARIRVENAAIGATGSDLAVFRAQRDLIDRGCDLVFIEYAVNDGQMLPERRRRTREGLIRQLLAASDCELLLVYTFGQGMYEEMISGVMPDSIAEFEELGAHYGLGSIWMGLFALQEVQQGRLRWEEWLPDGLHPQLRGSLSYAQAVIAYLERELLHNPSSNEQRFGDFLPAPCDPLNWQHAGELPFSEVTRTGPWLEQRWLHHIWIDRVLESAAPGARLVFRYLGRGVLLGLDFGKSSAEFRYRLDQGCWQHMPLDRPAWLGDMGWYRLISLAEEQESGEHSVELEVVHGNRPECTGTNFRLGLIGILK